MRGLKDYKDPTACYSRRVIEFIENGTPWEDSEIMQKALTPEEKGWNVKVKWGQQYIGDLCLGLGVFADEYIPEGTVIRTGRIGVNQLLFNKNTNFPNIDNKATALYLKHYVYRCPCQVKDNDENLVIYIPGSSFNHSTEPNFDLVCWDGGANMVASRDICKGEPLNYDYKRFGAAPGWFKDILQEQFGETECVFQGENDYV